MTQSTFNKTVKRIHETEINNRVAATYMAEELQHLAETVQERGLKVTKSQLKTLTDMNDVCLYWLSA